MLRAASLDSSCGHANEAAGEMILHDYVAALPRMETLQWAGRVRDLVGLLVASDGGAAAMGFRNGRVLRAASWMPRWTRR
jgi:hypothetical protein